MNRFRDMTRAVVLTTIAWAGTASADAVTDWNEIAAGAIPAGRPGPIGQMDMAVVAVAMHDAVQAYERRFEPYYVEIAGAKGSKSAAVAAAAHGVLVTFYPAQAATLGATYATWLANNGLTGNQGIAVGEAVAAKAATLRRLDPNPLPPPFTGGTEPGQWRPTESFLGGPPPGPPPSFAPMFAPWMASFDPFALTGPARYRAPPPPELTSARYTADYNEVKAKGALTGSTRTPEQTDIGHFWTDNFFAQMNRAARALVVKRTPNMGNRARLLALLNITMADALITSWNTKLHYNVWRPVTAIREGDFDGNPNTAGDPAWQSLINNPNYPDYASGANAVVGSAVRAFALFYGRNNISIEVTSNAPAAIKKTRTYPSFSAVAAQVVNARIYLGIHFRFADTAARTHGQQVAEYVHDHYLLPTAN
jgi:PAP2 superfamily